MISLLESRESHMHPRYQEWIRYVFDREVRDPEWYFDLRAPRFAATDEDYADLLRETFSSSAESLRAYSDAQVSQGIWFLSSPAISDFIFSLRDDAVPTAKKAAGIRAIFDLYRDCFAQRCTETLGHIDEPGASNLNRICYMFWDNCPITYLTDQHDKEVLEASLLWTLEQTIHLPHRACIEGGLHGLGHMANRCGNDVRRMIDTFLGQPIDPQLRSYAECAREGFIQ
jgi:hypothetical protein